MAATTATVTGLVPADGKSRRGRLLLSGGARTTIHLACHDAEHVTRPEGTRIGEVRTHGVAREHVSFDAPWHAVRACVHVEGGVARIARRDLFQAGPLLVGDGAVAYDPDADDEGCRAAADQFDPDPTHCRHPRAALGCDHALNLDGGGSTALISGGRVQNLPRGDCEVPEPGGRPISTAPAFRVVWIGVPGRYVHGLVTSRSQRPRAVMGLAFFPRGGSAHVARNLATALGETGWDVAILSGSVTKPGEPGDASEFYAGLDVRPQDFTRALEAPDPMRADPPMHPSYEDRPGAADRIFASLDDDEYERQVVTWCRALQSVDAAGADILHLHHLTPLNEAAARVAPDVPVVGHLHGTELLMLEAIEADPGRWPHGPAWAARMRDWATACERIILLSQTQEARAEELLGIDEERCVLVPNGFDPKAFKPRDIDHLAHWRRHLVDEPRGWAPGEGPGSVRYDEADLDVFADAEGETPVLLYVGRFTEVKRVPLLVEAYARARPGFARCASLVLVGGFPGEWEGEHPLDAIRRTGAEDVFLAGWHGHDELPSFLAASDVVVLPSVREQFGQVLVEGMACGLPAIAVDAWGPGMVVEHGETGWLVPPDDVVELANALVYAVNCPAERRRRGERAVAVARERYSWPALAEEVAAVYGEARRDASGLLGAGA
jgi:glycosyltransferase involved in cell wall biosynthesis